MTNQEIDEAVAKKLGWDCVGGSWRFKDMSPFQVGHNPIKSYSTDISAAWEIVEHCKGLILHDYPFRKPKRRACLVNETTQCEVEAPTAPMAICLAFLKLDKEKRD